MTKKIVSIIIAVTLFMASCKKENTPTITNEAIPTGMVLASANFVSDRHPTSGTVKVIEDVAKKRFLVFENFKSDNGPDLRVWLSPNNNATPYQEVGVLKAVSGNFYYELSPSINYTTNNRVLIWCEDVSVLFGYAVF